MAGNLNSYSMGNEAALTAGAVTATTHDAAAVWYNPAGLGAALRAQLDISASAFVFRHRRIPSALAAEVPHVGTVRADIVSSELVTVPASLVFARSITEGVNAAFGVFVPEQDYFSHTAVLQRETSGGTHYEEQVAISDEVGRLHAGGGVGWQVHPTLRVGTSLFAVWQTTKESD